ncbi:phospholipase-like protein [Tanacetum coccineum]|uniref:Phospholipase-like protein n=1 Tax=Tanacetum coccineum TaxID=301880 RepID=A0ABQ5CTS8_9ASTR
MVAYFINSQSLAALTVSTSKLTITEACLKKPIADTSTVTFNALLLFWHVGLIAVCGGVACGRQVEVEGDGDENVPLYYDIIDNFRIQFGREEFCLITGLRFGDLDLADYNDREMPTGVSVILDLESFRVTANQLYYHHNLYPIVAVMGRKKGKFRGKHVYDFFQGNMPAKRLTPDETEARAKWWISSRAYFDGGIGQSERLPRHLNRQNMYEVPSELYRHFEEQKREIEEQKKVVEEIRRNEAERKSTYDKMVKFLERINVEPVREANTGPIFVNQHFGISDLSEPRSMQEVVPSSSQDASKHSSFFNIGTTIKLANPNASRNLVHQIGIARCRHSRPLLIGNLLSPRILNILNRRKREQRPSYYKQSPYMEQPPTTILPKQRGGDDVVFLGWHDSLHMNAWVELLIRYRTNNDPWTVAYTNTISVHPENQRFMIETDQHTIGTLDGSTRPYPAWSAVNWVFLPIHVAGNHWVTGVIDLPNSHFYVFDSLPNEGTMNLLRKQIQRWTPVVNSILQGRGCFNETRGPYNFQFSYNNGFWEYKVPSPNQLLDCGVPSQVSDEAVHKELGDMMERDAATASSLEAKQDSDTILGDVNAQTRFEITSKQSIDLPLLRGYTLGSGKEQLKLVLPVFVYAVKHMLMLPGQVSADEVNLIIYTSCIEQFWATAKVQTVNGVRQLQALVDKKRVIVTESSIRKDLYLDDAEGTDCLPTATIFEELARIGYEKPSQKLTFYKAFFSPGASSREYHTMGKDS